ncbi:unnamed protein product [Thlaspi arvense]|uniref:SHSP domain-containing protein n=1 Tax=Thlaspi arvense TaxID=13288 RepID=A0AAU9RQA7_THLAR|nr:unnamed protein product [Thlaspi arvense]
MSKAGSSGVNNRQNFPPNPNNRFQKSGSEAVYEVKETKSCVIYRVDMPGCPVSDLVYWVDGKNVHFFADEPAMPEYDHEGRKYGGTMVFNTEFYEVKGAKAKILNGVLWITVPKIPGKHIKLNVIEKMVNVKITRDDVV